MQRNELDQRYTATLNRWRRSMDDDPGRLPHQLLDELAQIAQDHAADASTLPNVPEVPAAAKNAPAATPARRRGRPPSRPPAGKVM